MSSVVPFESAAVPDVLRNSVGADDLSAGTSGMFSVVSFRGKTWRIKWQGEEHPILDDKGDPVASIEVVIVKGSPVISKNYYAGAYVEGAADAPDCLSIDGVAPDPSSLSPQSKTCATCPQNVFGSRVTNAGKRVKACQDNRRLAVVPARDILNENFGGPMLLRVPTMSLADLATYGKGMAMKGYPYNAIVTRVGFDMDAAYPKLTWRAVRPLTDEEAEQVKEVLAGDVVHKVLADSEFAGTPASSPDEPAPAVITDFEKAPVAAAKPAGKAASKGKPKPPPDREIPPEPPVITVPLKEPATPPPAADDSESEGLDKEIADILEGLDKLD